jgi:hypothetical protein
MAKKQIQLSIADPCTENWQKMTPNNEGKFCTSCQKTVVDFSTMSDAEVIRYFEHYKGATCGRFTEKQLSAPITVATLGKPQRHWAWALSALLLPTFAASQTVKPSELISIVETPPSVKMDENAVENGKNEREIILHGVVSDSSYSMIPGASVVLKGTTIGTVTDIDGQFELHFSTKEVGNQDFEIVVSAVGYDTQTLKMNASFEDKLLNISLFESKDAVNGIFILEGQRVNYTTGVVIQARTTWTPIYKANHFFKRLFRKK